MPDELAQLQTVTCTGRAAQVGVRAGSGRSQVREKSGLPAVGTAEYGHNAYEQILASLFDCTLLKTLFLVAEVLRNDHDEIVYILGGSGAPWRVLMITFCDQTSRLRPPGRLASRRFR